LHSHASGFHFREWITILGVKSNNFLVINN
jgi:hypothetical protein